MYQITFCRYRYQDSHGVIRFNCKCKGVFSKKFNTLSEIAKYYHNSNLGERMTLFVKLNQELSCKEVKILYHKIVSLSNKYGGRKI